jgi:hypothetical protein
MGPGYRGPTYYNQGTRISEEAIGADTAGAIATAPFRAIAARATAPNAIAPTIRSRAHSRDMTDDGIRASKLTPECL